MRLFSLPTFVVLVFIAAALGTLFPTDSHGALVYTYVLWGFFLSYAAVGCLRWMRSNFAWKALPGKCANCGYDLRATPGRCPECGTPAARPQVIDFL